MARVVVVATSPVARAELAQHVGPDDELAVVAPAVEQSRLQWLANDEDAARERAQHVEPEDELAVVAPAVEQSRLQWLANDEDAARERARAVGESIADRAPTDAEAVEVKPDPPSQAVSDAIAEHAPDRILVVVRQGEDATWLEQGEAERIPDELAGVPVTLVEL